LAAFLDDAVAAVLLAGLFAARHHQRPVAHRQTGCGRNAELPGGLLERREQHPAQGSVV
jgi:hypothetical protein